MANIEINELPPAVSLDGTELIAIDKNTGPGYVTQSTSINSLGSLGVTQPYVVAQVAIGLPNSRLLSGAAGQINVTDGGAGGNITVGLAMNGVTPGTYGDGTHVARVTVDDKGRITSASQVSITNQGDVVGPGSSVAGNIPVFSTTTGKLLSDSGKALPSGAVVGTTDTQTLTNKSIDASQLTGTVAYARLPIGTIASTVAAGDDSRIVNALNKNNNLSDVANPTISRTNIGAAASGANLDITSLAGLTTALSISQGGTGTTTSTGSGSLVLSVSPALTGTPTVPTAAVGTNTTQAASTAFVLAQAASTTPVMDGIGAVGVSTRFARADHVHPSDTSRLAAANNLSDVANPAAAAANIGAVAVGSVNRFTATQQWAKGADISSAAALPLGADGNFFHVTGTTGITSISTQPAGTQICLEFTGALTITHNATSLILPNGANIVTYPGYCATFISEGSGNWRLLNAIPRNAPTRQVFTASGTYTPPPGLVRAFVQCIGGGGGGNFGRSAAGNAGAGSGGGSGAYSASVLSSSTIGASQTVTIGAGGAGGIGATPVAATAGGDTSFGTLVIAKGGQPGVGGGAVVSFQSNDGGVGGSASAGTGDIKSNGNPGGSSVVISGSSFQALPGNGGGSQLGGGGQAQIEAGGVAGTLGGGGGGVSASNGASRNGGAGGSGIVIVDEYY